MVQLSFVIPCYRSEHTILQVLNEINKCENRGSISGSVSTGGICSNTGCGVTVKNCINFGTVTSPYYNAGGIVCNATGTTIESSFRLHCCQWE